MPDVFLHRRGECSDCNVVHLSLIHIYAVYSISDPRAKIFKSFVEKIAIAKHREKSFALYDKIERLAPEVIAEKRHIYKGVSANVDFYSGFVYEMLGIPVELFTPIFAVARIAGWSAHRIEEITVSYTHLPPQNS